MARKKLLNESTVRRFQSLANIKPLKEMYHMRDDEMMNEEEEMEVGAEEEVPAKQPEMEMGEEGGQDLELTDEEAQAIIDLGSKLEAAMGAMGGGEMAADDMGGEEMAGDDMGEEELMEALRGISYVPSKQEVVNEVAKRVAKRLQQAKLHEAKLDRALGKRR